MSWYSKLDKHQKSAIYNIDLAYIIGQYVELKNVALDVYTGKCPFCRSSNNTFTVYNQKRNKKYYCSTCGCGGDSIGFIQYFDNLDFETATKRLLALSKEGKYSDKYNGDRLLDITY
jgi:DNA primase